MTSTPDPSEFRVVIDVCHPKTTCQSICSWSWGGDKHNSGIELLGEVHFLFKSLGFQALFKCTDEKLSTKMQYHRIPMHSMPPHTQFAINTIEGRLQCLGMWHPSIHVWTKYQFWGNSECRLWESS